MGEFYPFVRVSLNILFLPVIICVYSAALPPSVRAPRMVCSRAVRIFHLPEPRRAHFA
jgi:hypothetical protein